MFRLFLNLCIKKLLLLVQQQQILIYVMCYVCITRFRLLSAFLCVCAHLEDQTIQYKKQDYSHSTDKENEARRDQVTFPRLYSQGMEDLEILSQVMFSFSHILLFHDEICCCPRTQDNLHFGVISICIWHNSLLKQFWWWASNSIFQRQISDF